MKILIVLLQIMIVYACSKRSGLNMQALSSASSLYVNAATGNDDNSGSTPASAFKTIQKAANLASPGCHVQISGGIYKEQISINVSGTLAKPILFSNYNSDLVFIDGSSFKTGTMLSITDKSNLIFRGLTIQNLTASDAQGIFVNATEHGGVSNITFKQLTVKGIGWSANAASIPAATDNAQPISVYGEGLAQANAVTNIIIDSSVVSGNIPGFSEAISFDGNIDGFTVSNNSVSGNSNIGIAAQGNYGTSASPAFDQARNGLITGNTCYNNITLYATSAGIYVDGARDIKISRNRSYSNGTGIEVGNEQDGNASNITVFSNLLYLNQVAGLAIGGYDPQTSGQVLNSSFNNNTLYANNTLNDGSGEFVITKASNCIIENNIFFTSNQNTLYTLAPIIPQSGNTINFNCWYTGNQDSTKLQVNYVAATYTTFSQYRLATRQDLNSIFTAPIFTQLAASPADFHLLTTSKCVNAGTSLAIKDATETNFDGKLLLSGSSVNMGAY